MLKRKKIWACLIVMSLLICFVIRSINLEYTVKADSNNEYSQKNRDTTINVNSDGTLSINRKEPIGTSMGEKDSWTIFIYMVGSNLESQYQSASRDIEEMINAQYGNNKDKVNIIIQTGGCESWQSNNISNAKIQRYRIDNNGLNLLYEEPIINMGLDSTLYNFLSWGITNYASEHMAVVFWNHGGGIVEGVCSDPLYNDDGLTLNEMEYAFSKLMSNMMCKFEFIGFDTCLSGSLEYANIFAPYAKYMVASSNNEPGSGWYYTDFINKIINNPDIDGLSVAKQIVDDFYKFYIGSEKSDTVTLAVYDLSKIDRLCQEYNYFAKYLYNRLKRMNQEDINAVFGLFYSTCTYAYNNRDIGSLIKQINTDSLYDYNTYYFEKALKDVVIYNRIGEEFKNNNAEGISIFTPNFLITAAVYERYRNACFSPYWFNYVELMNSIMSESVDKYKEFEWDRSDFFYEKNFNFLNYRHEGNDMLLDNKVTIKKLQENSDYVAAGFPQNWLEATNNKLQDELCKKDVRKINAMFSREFSNSINFNISIKDEKFDFIGNIYSMLQLKKNNKIICLGESTDVEYDENTKEIKSLFSGKWFRLPDGQVLTTHIVSTNNISTIYEFPVDIDGVASAIRMKEVNINGKKEYSILGIWDAMEDNFYSARSFLPINNGTSIKPIYKVYNEDIDKYELSYGKEYIIDSRFDIKLDNLDDGEYSYGYLIKGISYNMKKVGSKDFSILNGSLILK